MSKLRKFLIAVAGFVAGCAFVLSVTQVAAQSFGISGAQFFKRIGTAILPTNSTWTIGSSGNRVASIYAMALDATTMMIGGAVGGDLNVSGNTRVYGSSGLTTPVISATSTGEGLNVTGRGVFGGVVTTTGGIVPATSAGASIGSSAFPYNNVTATGTATFGGALTILNGNSAGSDHICVGKEQSPSSGYACDATATFYASSTGYVDVFKLYAGGNGADGACFSAWNQGATLGRQCQVSGNPSYYLMALNGLGFQGNSQTPGSPDMAIRSGNVGIGTGTVIPNTRLEVVGSVSSTGIIVESSGYLQFKAAGSGAPTSSDCDSDSKRGRFYIETTLNRFYVCNGATRGWDYTLLID